MVVPLVRCPHFLIPLTSHCIWPFCNWLKIPWPPHDSPDLTTLTPDFERGHILHTALFPSQRTKIFGRHGMRKDLTLPVSELGSDGNQWIFTMPFSEKRSSHCLQCLGVGHAGDSRRQHAMCDQCHLLCGPILLPCRVFPYLWNLQKTVCLTLSGRNVRTVQYSVHAHKSTQLKALQNNRYNSCRLRSPSK